VSGIDDYEAACKLMLSLFSRNDKFLKWVFGCMTEPEKWRRLRLRHSGERDKERVELIDDLFENMKGLYNFLFWRRGEFVYRDFAPPMPAKDLVAHRRMFWLAAKLTVLTDWRFSLEHVRRFLSEHVREEDYMQMGGR
jgi:hypothetical protein